MVDQVVLADGAGFDMRTADGDVTTDGYFDSNWTLLSAQVVDNESDGRVVTQDFDSAWRFTGGNIAYVDASGADYHEYYDASWRLTGATVETDKAGHDLTETFGADWVMTSAHDQFIDANNVTNIVNYDGSWNVVNASQSATLSDGGVLTQFYGANWTFAGATIQYSNTAADVSAVTNHYDQNWFLFEHSTLYSQGIEIDDWYGAAGGAKTYNVTNAAQEIFHFSVGQVAGDTINILQSGSRETLDFSGYGAGAAFTQTDATHWTVSSAGHPAETITVVGLSPGQTLDYSFA